MSDLTPSTDSAPLETASQMLRPSVSVVTVSYYTGDVLWANLETQLAQPELAELILIDNGNMAATRARLDDMAQREKRLKLIRPKRNLGFAAGCNRGAALATSDFLAFVNPDCELRPGTFAAVLDVFAAYPDAWICGGNLQYPDGREQRGGRRQVLSPWRALMEVLRLDRLFPNHPYFQRLHDHETASATGIIEVPVVSGAFMVIPRRYFERLGGMDDHMFLHFDDADLCIRVGQQGGKVLYAGHVPVPHHLSTSDVSRIFIEWHKTRSTSYYFVKHFHATYPRWTLSVVSVVLWIRFLLLVPVRLPRDLPGIWRRLLRR